MKRRAFLRLVGVALVTPCLPAVESPYFIYRGYGFRKDVRPEFHGGVVQLYAEVEIRGERYCNAFLIGPEVYEKCRDMYCDCMIKAFERKVA